MNPPNSSRSVQRPRRAIARSLKRALRKWHRRIGITVALLAIWLAITGIALNHSERLALRSNSIGPTLASWFYGFESGAPELGWVLQAEEGQPKFLSLMNGQLFLNAERLGSAYKEGSDQGSELVRAGPFLALVTQRSITLLTERGEVIERLPLAELALPFSIENGEISALTVNGQLALIQTSPTNEQQCWAAADIDLVKWQVCDDQSSNVGPIAPKPLANALRKELAARSQNAAVTWEQLLIDLHSGRVATRLGVLVVDISGVLLIFLAISGLWIGLRRKPRAAKRVKRAHKA